MRILFLAPQPFFQERGTPIAVRLALEVLALRYAASETEKDKIDLLTYHEGDDISMPGVKIERINPPGFLRSYLKDIRPGISLKKLLCDMFFLYSTFKLIVGRRNDQYKLIHAVEESVFIALLAKLLFRIPYIYDMDSSLAMQVTEKWHALKPLFYILNWFEKIAVRNSMAVAPVCDSLGVIAKNHGSRNTFILQDISLIKVSDPESRPFLHQEAGVSSDKKIILYVGNLEPYQGIDLLVESYQLACREENSSCLVIIGGNDQHIEQYRTKARDLKIEDRVLLLGPRPVEKLGDYVMQADILVSPRSKGNNTPMKIYSYLHAGKAILATDMPTHTQVLTSEVAELAKADAVSYAQGLLRLLNDDKRREDIGRNAQKLAEEKFTYDSFSKQLNMMYDQVGQIIVARPGSSNGNSPDYSRIQP